MLKKVRISHTYYKEDVRANVSDREELIHVFTGLVGRGAMMD